MCQCKHYKNSSRIREPLNFATCANNRNDTTTTDFFLLHMQCVRYQVSGVRCQVSGLMCHLSYVTCPLITILCSVSCYESPMRFDDADG